MNRTSARNALVDDLAERVLLAFSDAIPSGARVALVDFPNHPNGGDTAIWLGERALLRKLGCDIAYVASYGSYSPVVLRRRIGSDGIVLLHGGGNFGDVWPTFQKFRERVFAESHDHRVVQLPQSLQFGTAAALAEAAAAIDAHPDAHIMVRDRSSEKVSRASFPRARTVLTPDAAFGLGPLSPPSAVVDILVFARTDHEQSRALPIDPGSDVLIADWPSPSDGERRRKQFARALGFPVKRVSPQFSPLTHPLRRVYAGLAAHRMERGLDTLAQGRVIVTDRLHGHILALLLGRPHVVLDNSYGKNRRFFEAWTSESPLTHWAGDFDEGIALARTLIS